MNINDFNKAIHSIRREVDLTKIGLTYDKAFSSERRESFNHCLETLQKLFVDDGNYHLRQDSIYFTAHRIVQLNKIHEDLEEIRKKILFCMEDTPYYVTKIKNEILPPLQERIHLLRELIGAQGRLPLPRGDRRRIYHLEIQQDLQLKTGAALLHLQKEYFHLMGNHFDQEIEEDIALETYTGNNVIYSFQSWKKILQLFIESEINPEKYLGKKILSCIQKAISTVVKVSYANNLPQFWVMEEAKREFAYYADLVNAYTSINELEESSINTIQFSKKYQLGQQSHLPKSVVVNEIVWDIIDQVTQLKEGEYCLFPAGTINHCVIFEITCIGSPTHDAKGMYRYTIFNTGDKVSEYHQLETSEFAYPLVFNHLTEEAFSYLFISKLMNLYLKAVSMDDFYALHDHFLVEVSGGVKTFDSGALYPLQKFGTCTYSSLEAWIQSFLNPDQKRCLDFVKVNHSVQKQEEFVKILVEETGGTHWKRSQKVIYRKKYSTHISKTKLLEDSQLLLNVGQKHLSQIGIDQLLKTG